MSRLGALLSREIALAWGRGGGPLVAVGFYAGVATFLPLAIGPEPERLAAIAPGAAWVALALASLLSLERLFERDYEDGALDLLMLSPTPLELRWPWPRLWQRSDSAPHLTSRPWCSPAPCWAVSPSPSWAGLGRR